MHRRLQAGRHCWHSMPRTLSCHCALHQPPIFMFCKICVSSHASAAEHRPIGIAQGHDVPCCSIQGLGSMLKLAGKVVRAKVACLQASVLASPTKCQTAARNWR